MFRSLLRVAADATVRPFVDLTRVPMDLIPSFVIDQVVQAIASPWGKLPGSHVHDRHLAALAAYSDVYVANVRGLSLCAMADLDTPMPNPQRVGAADTQTAETEA